MDSKVAAAAGQSGRFSTTRWSLIVSSRVGNEEDKAREALAQLCRIYWRPIFAFICQRGYSVPDAQDQTQEFFLMILRGNLIQRANPDRGPFRALLRKSLENFLADADARTAARKRGGKIDFTSWDEWMAESPSHFNISRAVMGSWPAERIFDVRWAATLAERALQRLAEECEKRGRRRVFDTLSGSLTAERTDISYEALARQLGVGATEIRRALHRLRQRYRALLRDEVAATVEDSNEVEGELRYLVAALAAGRTRA